MRVLRGGPDNLSPRLPCITRPMWLRTVSHRPVGPISLYIHCTSLFVGYPPTPSFDGFGLTRVFSIWINIILLLFCIWFDFNLNWAIRITCLLVFSVDGHIRVWILLHFYIISFSRLIWDPGLSQGLSPLAPGWYRESPFGDMITESIIS
jgi:hypothetical protein